MDTATQDTPIRTAHDEALDIVHEVVDRWRQAHYPHLDLQEQMRMIAARVPTWIAPISVVAGVGDIMSAVRHEGNGMGIDRIEALGNELATRFKQSSLLAAQPRRAGLIQQATAA